jgi:hypothetical protein
MRTKSNAAPPAPSGIFRGTVISVGDGRAVVRSERLSRGRDYSVEIPLFPGTPGLATEVASLHSHALRPAAALLKPGDRVLLALVEGSAEDVVMIAAYPS